MIRVIPIRGTAIRVASKINLRACEVSHTSLCRNHHSVTDGGLLRVEENLFSFDALRHREQFFKRFEFIGKFVADF